MSENIFSERKQYNQPALVAIKFDNEISLALASLESPPPFPGESILLSPEFVSDNPLEVFG